VPPGAPHDAHRRRERFVSLRRPISGAPCGSNSRQELCGIYVAAQEIYVSAFAWRDLLAA
jgi:hypothetical protein